MKITAEVVAIDTEASPGSRRDAAVQVALVAYQVSEAPGGAVLCRIILEDSGGRKVRLGRGVGADCMGFLVQARA
jgi:hypothetical protein